ncbi:MAG: 3D domain-containing protein [Planctomycetota bacterium]
MKKAKVQSFCGFSLNRRAVIAMLLVRTFVLGCIISEVYTKADGRVTSPSTTATGANVVSQPALNESEIKGGPEQSGEWQTVLMRVTAYCPCEKCCGEYADGITACGHKIRPGDAFVAADRRYSFGTEMLVPGYNDGQLVKVLDRGGAIRGDRLDVFFHSHEQALKWGVKYLDVKVHPGLQTQ